MKRICKIISLIWVICLLSASFSGCRLFMNYQPDVARYNVTEFKDMSYTEPDIDRFYELSKLIEEECGSRMKAISVNDYFTEMVDIYNSVHAMISLLSVYTAIDTGNKRYAEAYLNLQNEVVPVQRELVRIADVIKNSKCAYMIEYYYGDDVWDTLSANEGNNISDELEALISEENKLLAEYNTLANKEYTIPAGDVKYYNEVSEDRYLSELEIDELYNLGLIDNDQYLGLMRQLYLIKNGELGEVYASLVEVRNKISKERGYEKYSDYAYKELYMRQYSADDFAGMRDYVKKELVPLYDKMLEAIDYQALTRANEFMNEAYTTRLGKTVEPVLNSISEDMLTAFEEMYENKMCNIYYSEKKADMSFTTYIQVYNKPFLFCTPSPEITVTDFFTLMHEFGHYYAYIAVPVTETNCNDLDSHEVLSQGLELIVAERIGDVFDDNELAKVSYLTVVTQILSSVIEGCKMDEFQERVFALENPTVDQINKVYGDVMKEYGSDFYDTGDGESLSWVDIPHSFIAPFYYVSYSVSAIAALQIWSMENSQEAYFDFLNGTENNLFLDNLKENEIISPFEKSALEKIKSEIISRTERVGVEYNV